MYSHGSFFSNRSSQIPGSGYEPSKYGMFFFFTPERGEDVAVNAESAAVRRDPSPAQVIHKSIKASPF